MKYLFALLMAPALAQAATASNRLERFSCTTTGFLAPPVEQKLADLWPSEEKVTLLKIFSLKLA